MLDAFGLRTHRAAWLIGGGGKTTLMFALAHALAAEGRTVLTTTTTKLRLPLPGESPELLLADEPGELAARIATALSAHRHVTVAASQLAAEGKLRGLPVASLDALGDAGIVDHILVEADGAAGRSLKAHLDHEPVVSTRPGLVIAVVGVDVLGRAMDDAHVHRAAELRVRVGRPRDSIVTAGDVAAALLGPEGYAARVSEAHEFTVFLAKAGAPASREAAARIAGALRAADVTSRVANIVIGDVRSGAFVATPGGP